MKTSGIEEFLQTFVNQVTGGFAKEYLRFSAGFLGDYLVTFFIVGIIHAARGADMSSLVRLQKPIAAVASISFSMYLVHYPLLLFFGALFPQQTLTIGVFTMAVVIVFGITFERNKAVLKGVLTALWPSRNPVPAYR